MVVVSVVIALPGRRYEGTCERQSHRRLRIAVIQFFFVSIFILFMILLPRQISICILFSRISFYPKMVHLKEVVYW